MYEARPPALFKKDFMKLNFIGVYCIILLFFSGIFFGHEIALMKRETELVHAEKVIASCNKIILGKNQ